MASNSNRTSPLWRRLKWTGRRIEGAFEDLRSGLQFLLMLPFQDLKRARRSSSGRSAGLLKTILLLPISLVLSLVSLILRIIVSPMELVVELANRRISSALLTLPALLVLGVVSYFLAYGNPMDTEAQAASLQRLAITAAENDNHESAIQHFEDLIELKPDADVQTQLRYIESLLATEQKSKAQEILKQLAPGPGQTPGDPEAHEIFAAGIASQLGSAPGLVSTLKWHLDNSGPRQSHRKNLAWMKYYIATGEIADAAQYSARLVNEFPIYFFTTAELYRKLGNEEVRRDYLIRGSDFFRNQVEKDRNDTDARLLLAEAYRLLGQQEAFEKTLEDGMEFDSSPQLQDACARMMLGRIKSVDSLEGKLDLIRTSLKLNPDLEDAFALINELYGPDLSQTQKTNLIKFCHTLLADEKTQSGAHFVLGRLYWEEGEVQKAIEHTESAVNLDSRYTGAANNLAWLLAHSDAPDLVKALEISKETVAKNPADFEYRDTLGTILLKLNEHKLAVMELELALRGARDKVGLHQKLATCYRELGQPELAETHERKANLSQSSN